MQKAEGKKKKQIETEHTQKKDEAKIGRCGASFTPLKLYCIFRFTFSLYSLLSPIYSKLKFIHNLRQSKKKTRAHAHTHRQPSIFSFNRFEASTKEPLEENGVRSSFLQDSEEINIRFHLDRQFFFFWFGFLIDREKKSVRNAL